MSNRQKAFLAVAESLAVTSKCRNKHGAVIVHGGAVIATGVNRERNRPEVFDDDMELAKHASIHAEIAALRRVSHVQGATLYVARVNRRGMPRLSRPCTRCAIALRAAGIKHVIYTTD